MATARSVSTESEADLSRSSGPPEQEPLLVAAIDFGTTYSGFAYSFKHEYERTPTQITAHKWQAAGGGIGLTSLKTPTTLLLKPNEEFEAFGFEAEESYAALVDDDAHIGWHYFKQFKMSLHKPKVKLTRTTKLKDDQDQEVLALTVFSESIKYLKKTLLHSLKNRETQITEDNVRWVLTVPAIWDDEAKQFMRIAAEEAGIKGDALILALEPEAASVYCKEVSVQKKEAEDDDSDTYLAAYDPGTKFMVIDLGGGTVDITVSKVMRDRTLRQIFCSSGGAWGGMMINREFWKFIEELLKADKKDKVLADSKTEVLDLEREIETQKRNLMVNDAGRISIKLGALTEYIDMDSLENCKQYFKGKMVMKKGKLQVPQDAIVKFFEPSVNNLADHLQDMLPQITSKGVTDAIMVGGFSESKIISKVVKEVLKELTVVHPIEAGLAVLKGAVLFGHNPAIVSARACNFTYGTANHRYFLEGDDIRKKVIIDGVPYCKDVFTKLAEKGIVYSTGHRVHTEVFPIKADMTKMSVHMYKSTEKDPKYVTEKGCSYMGKMVVDMPDTTRGLDRMVKVSLTFGKTELIYEGVDSDTKEKVEVKLDLLS